MSSRAFESESVPTRTKLARCHESHDRGPSSLVEEPRAWPVVLGRKATIVARRPLWVKQTDLAAWN